MTNTEMFFLKHVRRFDSIDTSCLEAEELGTIEFNSIVKFGLKIIKYEDEYLMYYYGQLGVLKNVDEVIVEKMLQLEKVNTETVQRLLREELKTQF